MPEVEEPYWGTGNFNCHDRLCGTARSVFEMDTKLIQVGSLVMRSEETDLYLPGFNALLAKNAVDLLIQ